MRTKLFQWITVGVVALTTLVIVSLSFTRIYRKQICTSGTALVQELLQRQINISCRSVMEATATSAISETMQADGTRLISVDTGYMNALAAECNAQCLADLRQYEHPVLRLPSGALTGSTYLSDKGKEVAYTLHVSYDIATRFFSTSHATGINQVRYAVYLEVQADAHVTIPTVVHSVQYTYYIPVCEMLYAGTVPNVYVADSDGTDYLDLIP